MTSLCTLSSEVRLFADDTIVYLLAPQMIVRNFKVTRTGRRSGSWSSTRQSAMYSWSQRKRSRVINPYKLHGQILDEVESAKYLGFVISNDMSWNRHIYMCPKQTANWSSWSETWRYKTLHLRKKHTRPLSDRQWSNAQLCGTLNQDIIREPGESAEKSCKMSDCEIPQQVICVWHDSPPWMGKSGSAYGRQSTVHSVQDSAWATRHSFRLLY